MKNPEISYRSIQEAEYSFLKEMLYIALYVPEGYAKFPTSILDAPAVSKYVSNWGSSQTDIGIVALAGEELIGAVWGRIFSESNKGYGFIDAQTPEISMAVRAYYRSRGIGTRLLTCLESSYQQLSIQSLSLSVDKRNPAQQLYKRMGFEYYKEEGTAYTMRKMIGKYALVS